MKTMKGRTGVRERQRTNTLVLNIIEESGHSLCSVFCSKDKSRQRSKEWAQQQRETKSDYSTVLNTMERMVQ